MGLIYIAAVIHLPHIHELLSPSHGDLRRVGLVEEGLVCSLDAVHGVPRPRDLGGEVLDAGRTAHFEYPVRDAKTKS